ncbi:MAG TPA: zf-HC2 domain-containing protein [Pirellulales bacterium]|jgi:anti-sigma factor RsiW|nr:zf-HC2 domain-containing protein [Pirellulales bacterium]
MTEPCPNYADLLDRCGEGVVPEDERWRVEAHLAQCLNCRSYVAESDHLGRLLKEALDCETTRDAPRSVPRRMGKPLAVAAAAVVLLTAVTWCLGHARTQVGGEVVTPGTNQGSVAKILPSAQPATELANWEASIDREANAARLAAAADVLAGESATSEYAAGAMRFLARAFPDTIAGRDAARRIGAKEKE